MTQEEKQLLLKDLCARLPYGVKGLALGGKVDTINALVPTEYPWIKTATGLICHLSNGQFKPYLRPMSSMTEEEKEQLAIIRDEDFQLVRQWLKNESIKETGAPCPVTCGEVDYW